MKLFFPSLLFIILYIDSNSAFAQKIQTKILDQDGDGIADSLDQCPNQPEIINFYQDEDGCPDEKPDPVHEGVIVGLTFEIGTKKLYANADSLLMDIAAALKAYPGTEIEIGAHVDNETGNLAETLSKAQADTVAKILQKMGVEKRRMQPVGYGHSRPLVPNRTAKGREQNRRIEIHRIN